MSSYSTGAECALCCRIRSCRRFYRSEDQECFVILRVGHFRDPVAVLRENGAEPTRVEFVFILERLKDVASRCYGNRFYIDSGLEVNHWRAVARKLRVAARKVVVGE